MTFHDTGKTRDISTTTSERKNYTYNKNDGYSHGKLDNHTTQAPEAERVAWQKADLRKRAIGWYPSATDLPNTPSENLKGGMDNSEAYWLQRAKEAIEICNSCQGSGHYARYMMEKTKYDQAMQYNKDTAYNRKYGKM